MSAKVFPEEMLGDACKQQQKSSSFGSLGGDTDHLLIMYDSCSTLTPSLSCAHLENLSVTESHRKEEFLSSACHNVPSSKEVETDKFEAPQPFSSYAKNIKDVGQCPTSYKQNSGALNANNRNYLSNICRTEQNRLTWKRCQRGRSSQSKSETMSLPHHVHFDSISQTSSASSQQPALSGDDISVISYSSTEQKNNEFLSKRHNTDEAIPCKQMHIDTSVESAPQVSHGVGSEYYHSVFCTKPTEVIHVMEMAKSDTCQTNYGGYENTNRKIMRGSSSKSSRHQNDSIPFQKYRQQKNLQSKAKLNMKNKVALDPIQSWMKLPRTKPIEDNTPHHLMNGDWRASPCLNSNMTSGIRRGQDVTQKQSSSKWILVGNKNMNIPKTTVSSVPSDNNDCCPFVEKGFDLKGATISMSEADASSDLKSSKHQSKEDMVSLVEQAPNIDTLNSKDECSKIRFVQEYKPINMPDGLLNHFTSSETAEQSLIFSDRLQLLSENVQQNLGYPLAEFERLLYSSAPAFSSSDMWSPCDGYFQDMCSSPFLCTNQASDASLHSVWSWYEEPGNYGLKVNVNDIRYKGQSLSTTESFHAYFVPLLSAVQLFGYNHLPSSNTKGWEQSRAVHGLEFEAWHPLCQNLSLMPSLKASTIGDTLSDTFNSTATDLITNINIQNITSPSIAVEPSLCGDAELIFEFFESEQPQRRKPLYNKITELANGEKSNCQVFGDPLKLDGTNMDDLHPASWFSVAWYPIYRIPEGKMRSAFLTYHSLGYLAQRSRTSDLDGKPVCLALPVIGLQSYNAQVKHLSYKGGMTF